MYQEISQLLMYGDLDREGILFQMGELFRRYEAGGWSSSAASIRR